VKVDPQQFLDLVEGAHKLVFVDIEAMGLKADYGSAICVSFKPFDKKPYTFSVSRPGDDKKLVKEAKEELEKYLVWCTYFGKGFDIKFLNTRLLRWGLLPIESRHHLDLFFTLKANVLTARKSQSHLLAWLETPEQKMSVSASDWADLPFNPKLLATMVRRCESDVSGLEALYRRCRHVIKDITR